MKNKTLLFFSFMYAMMLLASLIQIVKLEKRIEELKARPPIVYQADSYGGQIGKVTSKGKDGEAYFVEVHGYGRFLVNKEQYDVIVVGEEAPKDLLEKGN